MRQGLMGSEQEQIGAAAKTRDTVTFAFAAVGHAALLAAAIAFPSQTVQEAAPSDSVQSLIEIDTLREAPPRPEPPPPVPTAAAEANANTGAVYPSAPVRTDLPNLPPTSAEPAQTASPVVSAAPSADAYTTPVGTVPIAGSQYRVGPSVWSVPGVLPSGPDLPSGAGTASKGPVAAKAPGKGSTVLRDDLRAHDQSLGIGTSGATAVSNAVADAVRASNLPADTTAVLVARIGGDGALLSVGVHSFSSGDAKTWNGVALAAAAAVGKKKLGLAGMGPKGAEVQVRVQAAVLSVSGSRDPVRGYVPLLGGKRLEDSAPPPPPDGHPCTPDASSHPKAACISGAPGGQFDVADAVSRPHRVVKAIYQVRLLDDAVALAPSASPNLPRVAPSASASAPPAADAGAP
ncbi:MAG: hypothetical protein IPK82_21655 [Polyangiaceae bacterium]|nr:hypothetical protein [Polyangiaceae bacterium]